MTLSFDKAPLVEIIAELRWDQPHQMTQGQPHETVVLPTTFIESNKQDEFFMRFGGECYQQGFVRAERLVPPGFPTLPFQPIYRYRPAEASSSSLFQIGAGLFSANATPPYKSWEDFSPIVMSGVKALLNARAEGEQSQAFSSVSLRYIDAYDASFWQGLSFSEFMKQVLGFSINLPPAISSLIPEGKPVTPLIQMSVPLHEGETMNISLGHGFTNGSEAVIMDTTVSASTEISADAEAIMASLGKARKIIHDVFLQITAPIHNLMEKRG